MPDEVTTALAIPDEKQFMHDIEQINRFQKLVQGNMIPELDYGVIPGTKKPTLLKPGAEKIAKLLGLADLYEIDDRQEDWEKPFFRYLIRCKLVSASTGVTVSEGLGECNSMESKYRWRWVFPSEVPEGMDKSKLIIKTITTKKGQARQYRLENEDVFSQVNTILKMAKKRALVDAALSAGRLSNLFTQDMEDMPRAPAKATSSKKAAEEEPGEEPPAPEPPANKITINMDWLKEALERLKWTTVIAFMKKTYKVKGDRVTACLGQMDETQQKHFLQEVTDRLVKLAKEQGQKQDQEQAEGQSQGQGSIEQPGFPEDTSEDIPED